MFHNGNSFGKKDQKRARGINESKESNRGIHFDILFRDRQNGMKGSYRVAGEAGDDEDG